MMSWVSYMEPFGEVRSASSGGQALQMLGEAWDAGDPFDIALLDRNMPAMSGGHSSGHEDARASGWDLMSDNVARGNRGGSRTQEVHNVVPPRERPIESIDATKGVQATEGPSDVVHCQWNPGPVDDSRWNEPCKAYIEPPNA